MDLSFSGAGFMGCYYFGIVNCWNKYIPRERVRRVAGASAGSLIAAYYLMDLPLEKCLREIIDMTEDIRKRPLGVFDRSNQIVDILPQKLDKMFPDDAHKRVNGRLFVCMTRLKDLKSVVVSEFESRKDLIDALNCSCFIPVWSGNHVSTYKGVKHIDGGFTNNLPVFDEHTIRICCFAGPSDISPYDRKHLDKLRASVQGMPFFVTWQNVGRLKNALVPPPASYIVELLERGFHDAKDFILSNDLIQCAKCFGKLEQAHEPIYSRLKNASIRPGVEGASAFVELGALDESSDPFKRAPSKLGPAGKQIEPAESRRRKRAESVSSNETSSSGADLATAAAKQRCGFGAKLRQKLGALSGAGEQQERGEREWAPVAPSIVVEPADELECQQLGQITEETRASSPQCSSPDSGAPDEHSERLCKLKRAGVRKRRHSETQPIGASPIDRFVRRQSTTPEQDVQYRAPDELVGAETSAGHLLLVNDRFAMASSPLPSCPPSPNLNRHCGECIAMRQQARVDLIDEQIKHQAELYRSSNSARECEKEFAQLAAGGGLTSKLSSWVRNLAGQRSKYEYTLADLRQPSEIPSVS